MAQDNKSNKKRRTPEQQLRAAVRKRDCKAVLRALLSAPPTVQININCKATRRRLQRSPLHMAAWNGDLEMVQLLFRLGGDVESRDSKGHTPLQLAVWKGHKQVVKALLDQGGADLETKDFHDWTPFLRACYKQDLDIALLLIERGATIQVVDKHNQNALHRVCYCGDRDHHELVEILLQKGADASARNTKHAMPLHVAAERGRVKSLRLLLENGSDIEAKTLKGITALHSAVFCNRLEAVSLLLDSGAASGPKTDAGFVPLHCAEHLEVAEELIHHGASIFERTNDNRTPFDVAFSNNRTAVYQRILQHYQEKVLENHGRLSFHAIFKEVEFVETGNKKYVSLPVGKLTIQLTLESFLPFLLSHHPDMIRAQDSHRAMPLHIAIQNPAIPTEIVRWLIKRDVSTLQHADSAGRLPLHLACHARAPVETLQLLVQQTGADAGTMVRARDRNGALPLHLLLSPPAISSVGGTATTTVKLDPVEYLLKAHPQSAESRNSQGELPVMLACQSRAPLDVLFLLLKASPTSVASMIEHYNNMTLT